jgi:hypothetical protein
MTFKEARNPSGQSFPEPVDVQMGIRIARLRRRFNLPEATARLLAAAIWGEDA